MDVTPPLCYLQYCGIYHTTAAIVKEYLPLIAWEALPSISPYTSMEYGYSHIQHG